MLFHGTMRHDGAHCPGFHPELMPHIIEALENIDQIAARHGVKVHGLYNAAPEHVEFLIAEADSPMNIAAFLGDANPYGEFAEMNATPVTAADDLLAAARQMMQGR